MSSVRSVIESPWISLTQWTSSGTLPSGKVLIWQVAARKQNEEIISPYAPFPDAKFLILESEQIAKMKKIQNKYAGFHLILGIHFAQLGLLEDAEGEFVSLQEANPESPEAERLLRSFRRLRYFQAGLLQSVQ